MTDPTQDNEILRYYEAEMRYLREAGKEFAQAFPDRARMLNIDRIGERDPHVERLFEGFAFLMGRLRHKLDDELPELTEGLVSMLWPHYLRMIPSLSILELTPMAEGLQRHETRPAQAGRSSASTARPSPSISIRCGWPRPIPMPARMDARSSGCGWRFSRRHGARTWLCRACGAT